MHKSPELIYARALLTRFCWRYQSIQTSPLRSLVITHYHYCTNHFPPQKPYQTLPPCARQHTLLQCSSHSFPPPATHPSNLSHPYHLHPPLSPTSIAPTIHPSYIPPLTSPQQHPKSTNKHTKHTDWHLEKSTTQTRTKHLPV